MLELVAIMVKVKKTQTRQQKRQSKSWKNRPKPDIKDSEWEFEVPNTSPEGACVQFICENNRFPWWIKVLNLGIGCTLGKKKVLDII